MKILISYLTGIGNTIMCIPMLQTLHRQMPEAMQDVVVRHPASKELLDRIGCCWQVYVLNPKVQRTLMQKLRFLRQLRQQSYDISITTFPSNRVEFNLLSFFIGARRRIALRYEVGYFETFGFLQTESLEAEPNRHEIQQNLSLLTPLGIKEGLTEENSEIRLSVEEMRYAEEVLQHAHLTSEDLIIGFHPGCNPNQGNIYRRWPAKHFAMLADRFAEQFGAKIFVGFGGPEENHLYQEISDMMTYKPIIPENPSILKTAALIKQCKLFVAADSGLMHLAAAMNVPTIALSGPIDPARDAPCGPGHTVIRADLPCVPCNQYPHYQHGGSYIQCVYSGDQKGKCMQSISVDTVYQTIVQNYADMLTPAPAYHLHP